MKYAPSLWARQQERGLPQRGLPRARGAVWASEALPCELCLVSPVPFFAPSYKSHSRDVNLCLAVKKRKA